MQLVKQLKNGKQVIFDKGKFDGWCVYVVEANGRRKAPFDVEYFSDLKAISKQYPENKVYADFVQIYTHTNKEINPRICKLIDNIVLTYKDAHQEIIEKWFTVLYAGMIAEENKERAILKKKIKRLGMHQILVDDLEPLVAANFSKGKKWRELNTIMKSKGF